MATTADLLEATATTNQSGLGPTDVEAPISPLSNPDISKYFARRDFLIDAHRAWKERVRHVTLIANGYWHKVWPDLTREPMAPSVANVVELAIAHSGAVGGAVVPSVKVPVPFSQQGAEGERGARKRERRIRELREKSNYPVLLAQLWQDYDGAGACAIGVWANFDEPDPAKRNPYYIRFDPRHYYPVVDSHGRVTELLVARKRSLFDVTREYPEIKGELTAAGDEVEEWFWYTKDEFMHALVDMPQKDPTKRKMKVLARVPNRMSRIPVVEITRPTFDGERRGKFDQTIHILRTMHQLMSLTITRTEEEVYPAVAGYDVDKMETFGPGATMQYRSEAGKIDVFTPQQMFDVKDLISRLEDNARNAARYPQQLSGEPGASIASGRAIAQSMGALDASLALTHRQFEWGLAEADSLALEIDEVYCDGQKTIYGDSRDRKKPESFTPSRDIAGHYEVMVSYGMGAGSDPANREIRLSMFLRDRLISRKQAREELDFLEDPEQEEVLGAKEAMLDAMMAGLIAQAQAGDPELAGLFFKELNDPNSTMEEKVVRILERIKTKQAEAMQAEQGAPGAGGDPLAALMGGGGGLSAPVEGDSLLRGGMPGSAEGLPPLPSILGPSAPRQA